MIYLSLIQIRTAWIYAGFFPSDPSRHVIPKQKQQCRCNRGRELMSYGGGLTYESNLTLYLFLHPGTGQANGFSSPPFMHMELRMDSELMALSVVHDSSLSDSS